MNKMSRIDQLLWLLFLAQILFTLCGLVGLIGNSVFNLIALYTPLVLLTLHACRTLTIKRGLSFIILGALVGFIAEAISLHDGTLFGASYTYPHSLSLAGVPVAVVVYWAIFIYTGYWVVTAYNYWLGKTKPNKRAGSFFALGRLILADGLAVTAIDLLMDPVQSKAGAWHWTDGGPYFGVPVGNFVGWFCVTIIVTSIFRTYEYFSSNESQDFSESIILIPILGYLLIGLDFIAGAIKDQLPFLAAIGFVIVVLPSCINIWLFRLYCQHQRK
jgi:uncharacterized membrane protein